MTRTLNIPSTNQDPNYRYRMPSLSGKVEGRGNGIKTTIYNMPCVAKALKRPEEYITKFFGLELGAMTKIDGTKAVVNGQHDFCVFQQLLDKFILLYVLCPQCELPEIDIVVKKGGVHCVCNSCGYTGALDNKHRIASYIVKHPPEGISTVEKAQKRSDDDEEAVKKGKRTKQRVEKTIPDEEENPQAPAEDEMEPDTPECESVQHVVLLLTTLFKEAGSNVAALNSLKDEFRRHQLSMLMVPYVKVFCVFSTMFSSGEVSAATFENTYHLFSLLKDKSWSSNSIIAGLEWYFGIYCPGDFNSVFPFILKSLYETDDLCDKDFQSYYSKSIRHRSRYYLQAREAAQPFLAWLEEDPEGDSERDSE